MRKVRSRDAFTEDRTVTAGEMFGENVGKTCHCFLLAVEDYKEALDFDDKQEIKEGLERAQKLLKISQKRDYYKILGVSR